MARIRKALSTLFLLASICASANLLADHSTAPTTVTLTGSLQSELGCPGDWQPDCATTYLTFDPGDTVWQGVFILPAGDFEYKANLNDGWDENYGANGVSSGSNIPLSVGSIATVKFYYSHESHWITDNVNSVILTAVGSFQEELGCPGDWQPDCLRSWLQDVDGDGIYEFSSDAIPAGSYDFKVALDEQFDTTYPLANVGFTTGDGDTVTISFDSSTNEVDVTVGETAPGVVTLIGSLQDELGCPGDWQPDCGSTYLSYDFEDLIWQSEFEIPAGDYDYKVALDNAWDETYGGPGGVDLALSLPTTTDVKFYYSPQTNWVADTVNSVIATVIGDFQDEMGCDNEWRPDCLRSMLQDPDGDGIYSFVTDTVPAGNYEALVAHDESFAETYGEGGVRSGGNIPFTVPAGATLEFAYNPLTHILTIIGALARHDESHAIIHYYRSDGDYGDHTTGDYNDFWGLHLWGDGIDPAEITDWTAPKPFLGQDEYGRFAWVELIPAGAEVNFIVHRGDSKDGTNDDRQFDASLTPEIWVKQDDGSEYSSQAEAQGFATIHYHRDDGDYGDYSSSDFNDFWGLHLWGDGINPSEQTDWASPKKASGFDGFGVYFNIALDDASEPVNFIIHRGDNTDPGPDQSMDPLDSASVWINSGDATPYRQQGEAQDYALIHYHRDAGDYGDATSPDFNDFWGLHVWEGAASPNPGWTEPLRPTGEDMFGIYFRVDLQQSATRLAYILHRGDQKDTDFDQYLEFAVYGYEVWQLQDADADDPYVLPISNSGPVDVDGDINKDGVVDDLDYQALRLALGSCEGDARYNPDADLTEDGCVDYTDLRQWYVLSGNNPEEPQPPGC